MQEHCDLCGVLPCVRSLYNVYLPSSVSHFCHPFVAQLLFWYMIYPPFVVHDDCFSWLYKSPLMSVKWSFSGNSPLHLHLFTLALPPSNNRGCSQFECEARGRSFLPQVRSWLETTKSLFFQQLTFNEPIIVSRIGLFLYLLSWTTTAIFLSTWSTLETRWNWVTLFWRLLYTMRVRTHLIFWWIVFIASFLLLKWCKYCTYTTKSLSWEVLFNTSVVTFPKTLTYSDRHCKFILPMITSSWRQQREKCMARKFIQFCTFFHQ